MLRSLSEEELLKRYEQEAERVQYSLNDYRDELNRRATERHHKAIRALTWATVALTGAIGVLTGVGVYLAAAALR